MDKKGILKVFISSTYRDLKDVRRLLLQEIGEALEAVAMEKFVPVDNSPHDEAIQHLEESDICIFIIGDYYGTIIEGCTIRTDECGDCRGGISYTHCEYRRVRNAEKPHMVYIVENEISDILSKIEKFDLESTEENDILEFLRKSSISCSKAKLFSGYTFQEIKERWKIIKDKNKEKLDKFKGEISKSGLELYSSVKISKEEDYYNLCQTIKENLKEGIIRWYQEGGIKFADFAGRKEELQELLDKLHEKNSVCIVGTGGVGKTSLIQLVLLLEKLSGKRIYALFKEYSYNYTRAGYSYAKGEFHKNTFTEKLTLIDILKFVFQKRDKLEGILKMDKNGRISELIKKLDNDGSVLFIDDLQDAEKDVKDFVFRCGDSLSNGAVVAGVREKGRCYSNIGPLGGMKGNDLEDMIIYLAKIHDVEQYVRDNIDVWSGEIFRITQGHPMLVDIIVKNADVFPDCRELRGITGVTSIEDQEAVDEIMNRLIREILTKGELEVVHILSVFRDPVDKRIFHTIGGKEALRGIIKKGFFDWNRKGKLVFTFNVVKELLVLDTRKEHYDIARKYYFEELGRANESEHPNIYVEIIYHLLKMEEFEEASALFSSKSELLERAERGRVIELGEILSGKISDHYERAFILGFLGNLLLVGNEFSEAERALTEALEIYRTLAGQDPGVYTPDVAMTLNSLGNLFSDAQKFSQAEKAYKKALKIRKTLAKENPDVYAPHVAQTLSNLGLLYHDYQRFSRAEKAHMEALKIRRTLAKENPEAHIPAIAMILYDLGTLYRDTQKYSEAERALSEALKEYRALAKKNSKIYAPDVAMILNGLGNLYKDTGKFSKAEKAYTETLKMYKTLAEKNPKVYTPDVAGVLSNLGDLYTTIERFSEAGKAFAEVLEIYRTLEKEYPEAYTSDNALALNSFGILCSTVGRFSEAGKAFTEALKKYEALAEKNPDSYMPRVLMVLNNLGILYRNTRNFDKAKEVYAETLKKYKTLAKKNSGYRPHIAMTLDNLGLLYKDVQEFLKAEKACKEALEIYRVLANENPEVYSPYVALTLNNLGNIYSTIGKFDEAETVHAEALRIYRTLSRDSDAYMLDSAEALSSAGNLYSTVGKFDEAEKVYTEALEKYRILEKWNPETHIPDIALTLIHLGLLYGNTQRFSEAGKAFTEALKKYRILAKKNPDAYTYYVAGTLNNLGNLFKDVQEFSEAEKAFTEALEIYRILEEDTEAHAVDVAMTLINFGNVYKDLGKFSEAEKAFTEALEKYKTLAKKSPEAYTPNVAITLNNLGLLFDDIGEFDKAEKVYTQALKLRRNLAEKNPEVYIPDVATTLNNLGNLYRDTGRFSEAERAFAEVLEMYETLEKEYPQVYTPHVVETLINLGILYYDTKKYSQAEKAYIEALEKERTLVTQNPEVHNLDLAKNLNNLGNLYNDAGKFSEAETALTEALEKYRELAEENPEVYASYVALALNNLGTLYDKTKRFSEAEKVYTEALQTYRALEKEYPEVYAPDVATSLVNLGTLYSNTERLPEAEKIYGEALKIGRALARKNPEGYTSDVILILNNLGTLYSDTRRYSEAEKAFKEAFKKCKQAKLWFDAAKLAHNFSMINPDSKMLENSRRLLELAILFSKEEKYKYALKRANESIYWDLLENGTSMFGVLEALRDPALLSLDLSHGLTQKELERAQSDVRFQTSLVDTLLRKQVPCYEFIETDLPKNLTFIYIQELKNYFLFFALESEGVHTFRCRKEFFSIGIKLLYLLWFQQRSSGKPRLTTHMSMFDELSRKWFKILPQGLKNLIREKEQIVFSPDSYCSSLPLEAMHIDGKPLCTEKTAVRATSLHQFLRLTSKKPRFDSSLIVGNPWPGCGEEKLVYSLPSGSKNFRISFLDGAEEEANALMRTLPNTTALLGEEATGKRFISEVSSHSLIHFSGHGSLGRILFLSGPFSGFPPLFEPKEFSDLRKAERSDGKRINMMEEWHPVTDLDLFDVQLTEGAVVFLNACETGQHRYAGGGYYQGLPAVFLKNGAHSIISSLVPIFDKHSKEFALHFYENLLHTHSVSQSLKGAREKIRDTYKAQIYWIPYIHYGPPL